MRARAGMYRGWAGGAARAHYRYTGSIFRLLHIQQRYLATAQSYPVACPLIWRPTPEHCNTSLLVEYIRAHAPELLGELEEELDCDAGKETITARFHQASLNKNLFWPTCWQYLGMVGMYHSRSSNSLWTSQTSKKTFEDFIGHQFFPDAKINVAENMLTRAPAESSLPCVVFRGEDKAETQWSLDEIKLATGACSEWLESINFQPGDVMCGVVTNSIEALVWFLACQARGGIWSATSPDFGADGVVERFGQIHPKVLVASEGYIWKGKLINIVKKIEEIAQEMPSLSHVFFGSYNTGKGAEGIISDAALAPSSFSSSPGINVVHWSDIVQERAMQVASGAPPPHLQFHRVGFNDPAFILFSSGTTGKPKCITHRAGALLQLMKEHQLHLDVRRGSGMMYYTTTAWMMWIWSITSMASGSRLLLFDGNPLQPTTDVLWKYFDDNDGSLFGTSAKYLEVLRKENYAPKKHYELEYLKTICSTGSPLSHEGFHYVYDNIKKDMQLASISGGTDILSCFVLGSPIAPVHAGECQTRGFGMAVDVFDEQGKSLATTPSSTGIPDICEKGELVCTEPFPSQPLYFWGDDAQNSKYRAAYFEKYPEPPAVWAHGDYAAMTPRGGVVIYGRSDSLLNPGGVRIGTAEIYREVEKIPSIEDSVVVGGEVINKTSGVQDDVRVLLFVKMKPGQELSEELITEIRKQIKTNTTPRHIPDLIASVPDIPKTLTGKTVEGAVKCVLHNREVKNVKALANPEALSHFEAFRGKWT